MGEKPVADQFETRPRVPEDLLPEPISELQRGMFIEDFDALLVGRPDTVVVHHEHRQKRSMTELSVTRTTYRPAGMEVDLQRTDLQRKMKVTTIDRDDPGIIHKRERYYEVIEGNPEEDFYEEVDYFFDAKSGEQLLAPQNESTDLILAAIDEDAMLAEKLDINLLSQGRWQEAVDKLADCSRSNRVRRTPVRWLLNSLGISTHQRAA